MAGICPLCPTLSDSLTPSLCCFLSLIHPRRPWVCLLHPPRVAAVCSVAASRSEDDSNGGYPAVASGINEPRLRCDVLIAGGGVGRR